MTRCRAKKKTACSWGALQTAIREHYKRHSDRYWYAGVALTAIGLATCTVQPSHATMHPALDIPALVLENTVSNAVQTATVSAVLSGPNSGAGRGVSAPSRHGCGQGAVFREGMGAALLAFSTPCPPYALENAAGGFLSRNGA